MGVWRNDEHFSYSCVSTRRPKFFCSKQIWHLMVFDTILNGDKVNRLHIDTELQMDKQSTMEGMKCETLVLVKIGWNRKYRTNLIQRETLHLRFIEACGAILNFTTSQVCDQAFSHTANGDVQKAMIRMIPSWDIFKTFSWKELQHFIVKRNMEFPIAQIFLLKTH